MPPKYQKDEDDDSSDETYYVEKLLKCKLINGKKHYLVKWVGYPEKTWEPESHLPGGLRRQFHTQRRLDGKMKRRGTNPPLS